MYFIFEANLISISFSGLRFLYNGYYSVVFCQIKHISAHRFTIRTTVPFYERIRATAIKLNATKMKEPEDSRLHTAISYAEQHWK
jgi:hypothetical protein